MRGLALATAIGCAACAASAACAAAPHGPGRLRVALAAGATHRDVARREPSGEADRTRAEILVKLEAVAASATTAKATVEARLHLRRKGLDLPVARVERAAALGDRGRIRHASSPRRSVSQVLHDISYTCDPADRVEGVLLARGLLPDRPVRPGNTWERAIARGVAGDRAPRGRIRFRYRGEELRQGRRCVRINARGRLRLGRAEARLEGEHGFDPRLGDFASSRVEAAVGTRRTTRSLARRPVEAP